MTKNKNLSITNQNATIIFGYSLFALILTSFLISTVIPFGNLLVMAQAGHIETITLVVVFAVAVILPTLASYLIGNRATHAKNKSLHHYNGVLFGIAAYWLAQLTSMPGFNTFLAESNLPYPLPLLIINIVPVILTIAVVLLVAVTYAKKQNSKSSVLQHRPYQIVLLGSVIGCITYLLLNQSFDMNLLVLSISSIAIPIVLTALSYKILSKYHTTVFTRLSDAIIAMSMAWITIVLCFSLVSTITPSLELMSVVSYTLGLIVFVMYIYLRTRKS